MTQEVSSSAGYAVRVTRDVRIPSGTSGMTLSGDLYRPVTEDPVPALVTLHSSRKDAFGGIGTRRYLRHFAQHGYATLYVDCYGVGTSDGAPRPLLSPAEVDDGVQVVEWAAGQPWCTGRVGMWGFSHAGMITLAVAARRPSHLGAIFAMMGLTDPELDLVLPGGSRSGVGLFGRLSTYNIANTLLPPLRARDHDNYRPQWEKRLNEFDPWFADFWRNGPGDDASESRRIDVTNISVPAFCVAGWRDIFCDAMIKAYEEIRAPKRLLVGPWLHLFPEAQAVEPVSISPMACSWWDQWLGSHPNVQPADDSPVVYVQGRTPRWVAPTAWPPREQGIARFLAAPGGRLARVGEITDGDARASAPAQPPGLVTRRTDPTVGPLSGLSALPILGFGQPLDQHEDDTRSISFTSEPLAEDILIAGRPTAVLVLAGTTTAQRCVVKLTDVDETDRSTLITKGLADLSAVRLSAENSQSLVAIKLEPTCYSVSRGHRLRAVFSDADFPRLWPADLAAELSIVVGNAVTEEAGCPSATSISLPLAEFGDLPDANPPAPERGTPRKPRKELPPHRWEITRDHYRGRVSVVIETAVAGPYLQGASQLIESRMRIEASVSGDDPASVRMSAIERYEAESETGDHIVVDAKVTMDNSAAAASGVVIFNGVAVFAKQWEPPPGGPNR